MHERDRTFIQIFGLGACTEEVLGDKDTIKMDLKLGKGALTLSVSFRIMLICRLL
jgi:hypothetical protein